MKRSIQLLILALSAVGCATISSVTTPNREHLLKLSLGMEKQEIIKLMGTRRMKVKPDPLHSTIINNPYRSETLNNNGKSCEVLYYVTDDKNYDNVVHDSDLTPLVFDDNGRLIGWGDDFLRDFINRNQIQNVNKDVTPKKNSGLGKKKKK